MAVRFDRGLAARVLLLEEDLPFAIDIKEALAQIGCEVTILRDGNAGIAQVMSDPCHLIFASATLEGMNGFRLCNRLKKDRRSRSIPVVILWDEGSASAVELHQRVPTRADGYIRKPFLARDIVGQVRMLVPKPAGKHRPNVSANAHVAGGRSESGVHPADIVSSRRASGTSRALDAVSLKPYPEAAQHESSLIDEVRARLKQLENENAALQKELDQARALAARSSEEPIPETAASSPAEAHALAADVAAHARATADAKAEPENEQRGSETRLIELEATIVAMRQEAQKQQQRAVELSDALNAATNRANAEEAARRAATAQRASHDVQGRIDALEIAHAARLATERRAHKEAAAARDQLAAKLAHDEAEHSARVSELEAALSFSECERVAEQAAARSAYDRQLADLEKRNDVRLSELEGLLAGVRANLEAARASASADVEVLHKQLSSVLSERDAARANADRAALRIEQLEDALKSLQAWSERELRAAREETARGLAHADEEAARTLAVLRVELERETAVHVQTRRQRDDAALALESEREERRRWEAECARNSMALEAQAPQQRSHEAEKAGLVAAYEARLAAEQGAREHEKASHAQALAAVAAERLADQAAWEAQAGAIRVAQGEALAAMRAEHEQAMAVARAERQDALGAAEGRHREERARLEAEHCSALSALQASLATSTEEGVEALRRTQTELAKREAMLAETKRERDALANTAAEAGEQIHALEQAVADALAAADRERQALRELDEARRQEYGSELATVRAQHDREVSLFKEQAQAEIAAFRRQHEQGAARLAGEVLLHRGQLEEGRRAVIEAESALQRTRERLNELEVRVAELTVACTAAEAVARTREERVSELAAELEAARATFDAERRAVSAELAKRDAEQADAESRMAELRAEVARVRAES
jgi:DNA-binding response OmpR family regulator